MTTREQQLTEVFVEVADSLIDDFDVIDFLQQLSVRCMELLDVAAVGILLAGEDDALHVLAASDENTRLLELFALQVDEGPCVDCYADGRPRINVSLTDVQAVAKWPRFARGAQAIGFAATTALPLRLRGRVIGAVSLFRTVDEPLGHEDLVLAQALTDVATIAILQQRTLAHSEAERDQLQYALQSRIVIEQIKGILAERWQTSIDEAFSVFRAYARAHNRKLSDLARAIADGTQDTDTLRDFLPSADSATTGTPPRADS